MSDLISRQDAIDAIDESIHACNKALGAFDISLKDEYAVKVERASLVAFRETLEYMPSAQAEPKKGKWMHDNPNTFRCSRCNKYLDISCGNMKMNFCPNCGADMRGEKEETE